jgi:hypothetical protein
MEPTNRDESREPFETLTYEQLVARAIDLETALLLKGDATDTWQEKERGLRVENALLTSELISVLKRFYGQTAELSRQARWAIRSLPTSNPGYYLLSALAAAIDDVSLAASNKYYNMVDETPDKLTDGWDIPF